MQEMLLFLGRLLSVRQAEISVFGSLGHETVEGAIVLGHCWAWSPSSSSSLRDHELTFQARLKKNRLITLNLSC